ncbi:MAG: ABC transporter ATP-binding protein [Anaeroplasmataceae bacterium]
MNGSVNLSGKGKMSSSTDKARDKKKAVGKLLKYVFKHKIMLIVAIFLTISSSVLQLFGPYLSGKAIKELDAELGMVNINRILYYSIILVVFYVVSGILSYILNILMVRFSQKITVSMRHDLFNHIEQMPISFFDKTQTGDIISRMSYDIDTVNTSLSSDIVTLASSFIQIVGSFIMMLLIEPLLVLVFVVTVPLSMLFTALIRKRLREKFRARSRSLGMLNGYAEEAITGLKTIKAYSNEKQILEKFKVYNDKAAEAYCEADCLAAWNGPGVNFINNVSLSLISLFGSIMYMYSYRHMDIGKISSFVLYSRKFSGPINEIANIYSDIESAIAASERIFDILELDIERDNEGSICITDTIGHIVFENVKFAYVQDKIIINNLNLEVKPGSLVAIVGPTGAGKTTIINLLMRFYDVIDGHIYLDNKDINYIKKSSLRSMFSMVLQDTWLRNGTIYENICYGKKDATLDDVKKVCQMANIDDYIEALPLGYDTILNEGGDNISKGQKQLLTIARAMMLDSKMLILDEATSNVDTSTEMKIQNAMVLLQKNKTCFVIAHRLSTIRNADTILVLNNGDIVEQGNHEELMNKKGFYYDLYNSQFS